MEFKYLIIAFCLILGIFLIYKEITRQDKGWLTARIIASIIAVLSMGLFILPFSYSVNRSTNVNEFILVTPGASTDSLKAIKPAVLYTTDSLVLTEHKALELKYIPDLVYHLKTNPELNTIRVYGYGLSSADLNKLGSYALNFHFPAQHPDGIISCNWNSNLRSTETLQVQGIYNNTSRKPVLLILKGLGTTVDSIILAGEKSSKFSFKTIPALTGKAVFQLVTMQGKDTLKSEIVPFEVSGPQQMKIMVLASSPDFEYKFLKNWLYENKYPLSIRTMISKNKYSSDHLNMESDDLNNLNADLLQKFDVIIADETALSSLSQAEKNALYIAADKGLGLLIRVNAEKPVSGFSRDFSFYSSADQKDKIFTPAFVNQVPLKPLSFEQTLFIKEQNGEKPIISDQHSRILVSSKIYGRGKIIVSAIPATYPWLLSGNHKEYTMFWAGLISKTAKPLNKTGSWSINPALPVARQQNTIELESDTANMPSVKINDLSLHPKQNHELPFLWDAPFWTTQTGWNMVTINAGRPEYFYVYGKSDWRDAINEKRLTDNREFIEKSAKQNNIPIKLDNTFEKTVSSWFLLFLFLTSMIFLWVELKFLNKN